MMPHDVVMMVLLLMIGSISLLCALISEDIKPLLYIVFILATIGIVIQCVVLDETYTSQKKMIAQLQSNSIPVQVEANK
jgi:4-hydroxybenzoate polyprenyltransferase